MERPEFPQDLRLAVAVVAELRAFDLKEIAEFLAGISRVLDGEERVRVDGVLEVRLPPRIPEVPRGAEIPQRHVERRYLALMVTRVSFGFASDIFASLSSTVCPVDHVA